MTITDKLELLAAIVDARERTKFGLQSYHAMRDRVARLDYDMADKHERAAVKIFYEDIEDENLGPLMEKTTASVEELFQHAGALCEEQPLIALDAEFNELLERFVLLLAEWKPLSDACNKIAQRTLEALGPNYYVR